MSKLSIEARVTAGTDVETAIMEAISLSRGLGVTIEISFNGVRLRLHHFDELPGKLEEYHHDLAALARYNELLPGAPERISKLPSGEFQLVLTLEEIIIKIWEMGQVCVKDKLTPYKDNIVRRETLKWASFELNERSELARKAGVNQIHEFIAEYVKNHGRIAEKYQSAKGYIEPEWQPIVALLDQITDTKR